MRKGGAPPTRKYQEGFKEACPCGYVCARYGHDRAQDLGSWGGGGEARTGTPRLSHVNVEGKTGRAEDSRSCEDFYSCSGLLDPALGEDGAPDKLLRGLE